MMWLLYPTAAEAQSAADQIALNMGFPDGHGTLRWATPRQIVGGDHAGKWGFPAPREKFMVPGETVEYSVEWFPEE